MMKLIQNIDVYAPQHLGKKDVLTINDKIVKIAEHLFSPDAVGHKHQYSELISS